MVDAIMQILPTEHTHLPQAKRAKCIVLMLTDTCRRTPCYLSLEKSHCDCFNVIIIIVLTVLTTDIDM